MDFASPSRYVRSLRTLAPAGGFVSPLTLLSALLREKKRNGESSVPLRLAPLLRERLEKWFSAKNFWFASSGKASLYTLLLEIKAKKPALTVAAAAYGCPDIAAAVIRSGCRLSLFDIDESTLEPLKNTLDERPDAVVLSNLYGLIDPLDPWRGTDTVVVDDACQAALGTSGERRIGARPGAVGILSFGRGKAICGIGGGCILWNAGEPSGGRPPSAGLVTGAFKAAAYWLFEQPLLYWIPARLPFLKLGEVHYESDFPVRDISAAELLVALAQLERFEDTVALHAANAKLWQEALDGAEVIEPFLLRRNGEADRAVPLRYPVLFRDAASRDEALRRLDREGLGASPSYNEDLPSLLRRSGAGGDRVVAPGANSAARRLITLPVHRHVRKQDIERGGEIIRNVLKTC
jgi:dTDP-4-amino-4,6-dideoxygalactose transaminase